MSVAQSVENYVRTKAAGQIFDYQAIPDYACSPGAVMTALSRLTAQKRVKRLSKGKFYIPKESILGELKPSDDELINSVLYKAGKLKGYVTGIALYNKLGLTTQLPSTIDIAYRGGTQTKEFGTIRIRTIRSAAPIKEGNILYLQYLDALKDIKKISDSNIDLSLEIMKGKLNKLSRTDKNKIVELAKEYYTPQVKALLGLLLAGLSKKIREDLKSELNPTTVFKLNLDKDKWQNAREWNIR